MTEDVIKSIRTADLVLIGIGEELDVLKNIQREPYYQEAVQIINRIESPWMLPYLRKIMLRRTAVENAQIYESLTAYLNQKNYFIVSLCKDGVIRKSSLDQERIVEPCGGYDKLQCSRKCNTELYTVQEEILEQIEDFLDKGGVGDKPREPICPKCGSVLVFNNVDADDYMEEGYLDRWMRYKKWLQGTVNKKLCVLELGVGMKYPTVIRWPFEKIVFYNQKSELFRVHDKLYQVAEEIGERAYGICQKPEEFLIQ